MSLKEKLSKKTQAIEAEKQAEKQAAMAAQKSEFQQKIDELTNKKKQLSLLYQQLINKYKSTGQTLTAIKSAKGKLEEIYKGNEEILKAEGINSPLAFTTHEEYKDDEEVGEFVGQAQKLRSEIFDLSAIKSQLNEFGLGDLNFSLKQRPASLEKVAIKLTEFDNKILELKEEAKTPEERIEEKMNSIKEKIPEVERSFYDRSFKLDNSWFGDSLNKIVISLLEKSPAEDDAEVLIPAVTEYYKEKIHAAIEKEKGESIVGHYQVVEEYRDRIKGLKEEIVKIESYLNDVNEQARQFLKENKDKGNSFCNYCGSGDAYKNSVYYFLYDPKTGHFFDDKNFSKIWAEIIRNHEEIFIRVQNQNRYTNYDFYSADTINYDINILKNYQKQADIFLDRLLNKDYIEGDESKYYSEINKEINKQKPEPSNIKTLYSNSCRFIKECPENYCSLGQKTKDLSADFIKKEEKFKTILADSVVERTCKWRINDLRNKSGLGHQGLKDLYARNELVNQEIFSKFIEQLKVAQRELESFYNVNVNYTNSSFSAGFPLDRPYLKQKIETSTNPDVLQRKKEINECEQKISSLKNKINELEDKLNNNFFSRLFSKNRLTKNIYDDKKELKQEEKKLDDYLSVYHVPKSIVDAHKQECQGAENAINNHLIPLIQTGVLKLINWKKENNKLYGEQPQGRLEEVLNRILLAAEKGSIITADDKAVINVVDKYKALAKQHNPKIDIFEY